MRALNSKRTWMMIGIRMRIIQLSIANIYHLSTGLIMDFSYLWNVESSYVGSTTTSSAVESTISVKFVAFASFSDRLPRVIYAWHRSESVKQFIYHFCRHVAKSLLQRFTLFPRIQRCVWDDPLDIAHFRRRRITENTTINSRRLLLTNFSRNIFNHSYQNFVIRCFCFRRKIGGNLVVNVQYLCEQFFQNLLVILICCLKYFLVFECRG